MACVKQCLYDAARNKIDDEGEPEGVIAPPRAEQHINAEKQKCRHYGREHHATRGRDADKHSVPDKGSHACNRNSHCPRKISGCGGYDSGVVGEQREESAAAKGIQGRVGRNEYDAPHEQMAHRGTEHLRIARAVCFLVLRSVMLVL